MVGKIKDEITMTHYYLVIRVFYGGYSALNVRYITREWYDTESDCSWHVPGTIEE